jgi:hypothetical protein
MHCVVDQNFLEMYKPQAANAARALAFLVLFELLIEAATDSFSASISWFFFRISS